MGKKNILRSGFFNADRVTLLTVTAVFAVMAVLVYTTWDARFRIC